MAIDESAESLEAIPECKQTLQSQQVPLPESITAQVFLKDPRMVLLTNFLSDEECDHLLSLARSRWCRSTVTRGAAAELHKDKDAGPREVVAPQGALEVVSTNCTSSTVRLEYGEDEVVERVLARVASLSKFPMENVEQLVLVKYAPGEYFRKHHDGAMRAMTIFAYLNDVESGGETFFTNLGVKVRPAKGTAAMWPNTCGEGDGITADRRLDHEALPPGEGNIKYGMNCFVNWQCQRDCSNIRIVQKPSPDSAEVEVGA